MKQALLILENGKVYRGRGFGSPGASYGEVVFNTSMTGYTESITDPSYAGQILTFSYPLIGNYGVSSDWGESDKAHVVGVVVSELCEEPWHREIKDEGGRMKEEVGADPHPPVNNEQLIVNNESGSNTEQNFPLHKGVPAEPAGVTLPLTRGSGGKWNEEGQGSDFSAKEGLVGKDHEQDSRLRGNDKDFHGRLENFLAKFGKGGIAGIDTRELVKIIRQVGTMPAVLIVSEEGEQLNAAMTYQAALEKVKNKDEIGFLDWPRKVARKEVEVYNENMRDGVILSEAKDLLNEEVQRIKDSSRPPFSASLKGTRATPQNDSSLDLPLTRGSGGNWNEEGQGSDFSAKEGLGGKDYEQDSCRSGNDTEHSVKTIIVIDCGVKENILREVAKRGFRVVVVPPDIEFEELMKYEPNGIIVSNGPGDPRDYPYIHKLLQDVLDYSLNERHLPVFGICLGHQLIAHVIGSEVFKMKFGNRGVNQPVQNLLTGRAFLTSQNHSYAVKADTIPAGWEPLFVNLNDKTVEGLRHQTKPIFSVQFHPEACGGPRDTNWLFEEFISKINPSAI